jgi:hypothetical protein
METLKTGADAFYDSFSGLVPVKVQSVTAPMEKPLFDLGFGPARASTAVTAKVTDDFAGYRKGEVLTGNALHIVPRRAVKKTEFSYRIVSYKVEHDRPVERNINAVVG